MLTAVCRVVQRSSAEKSPVGPLVGGERRAELLGGRRSGRWVRRSIRDRVVETGRGLFDRFLRVSLFDAARR